MKGFIKISKYAGMREDLVQAGGGNSSYKCSEKEMVIKASGYQLTDVCENEGYAIVDYEVIKQEFLSVNNLDEIDEKRVKSIMDKSFISGGKPSIETFLHAVSGKYTLHTHPIVVNILATRDKGMEFLQGLFPEALIVPYATPGVQLARAYFEAYNKKNIHDSNDIDIVFLQNHGLVVSGNTPDEVINKTETVTKKIETELGIDYLDYHNLTKLWNFFNDEIVWKVTDENIIKYYKENGKWMSNFCPDCVVFLGKAFLKLEDRDIVHQIEEYYAKYGKPVVLEYNNCLYILADNVKKAFEIQSVLSFSAQVSKNNCGYLLNYLSEQEQNYLLNWDAEKFRRSIK